MLIKSPLKTEKFIQMIELQNTIAFVVEIGATKAMVKKEVEKLFGTKVDSVRTYVTSTGKKHALVKILPPAKAEDIAAKLKIV
jgi:ribosomal protein L23